MPKRKIGRLAQNDIRAAPGIGISWSHPLDADDPPTEQRMAIYPMAEAPTTPSHEPRGVIHDYDLLLPVDPEEEDYDPSIWTRRPSTKVGIMMFQAIPTFTVPCRSSPITLKSLHQTWTH